MTTLRTVKTAKWIRCANALLEAKKGLHWIPKRHLHPTDMQVEGYGAGIQYGLLFRNAADNIPYLGFPALVNISWDGGGVGFGSRSAVPILIQVMNTNSSSVKGVGLLGYLPYVEVPEGLKEDAKFVTAKKKVLQVTHYTQLHVYALENTPTMCTSTCKSARLCVNLCVYLHYTQLHVYALENTPTMCTSTCKYARLRVNLHVYIHYIQLHVYALENTPTMCTSTCKYTRIHTCLLADVHWDDSQSH